MYLYPNGDFLPAGLLKYALDEVIVRPLHHKEGMLYWREEDLLEPCRRVVMYFAKEPDDHYALFLSPISVQEDGSPDTIQVVFEFGELDDAVDAELFHHWTHLERQKLVRRRAANLFKDLLLAGFYRAVFLTNSTVSSDLLLTNTVASNDIEARVLSAIMSLDLPVLTNISVDDLARLRQKEDAFENFRSALRTALQHIDMQQDRASLAKELQIVKRDTLEREVAILHREAQRLRETLIFDTIVAIGALALTLPPAVTSLLAAALVVVKAVYDYSDRRELMHASPFFFYWRLIR